MTQAFPLQWPQHQPRAKCRSISKFKVAPSRAFDDLKDELRRFSVKDIVISSNIPLRRDGSPYRDGLSERLEDPGVAVYFERKTQKICLPCDTYFRPWENMRAISLAIESLRAMDRHGAHQILDQAFTGFMALPAPDMVGEAPRAAWWVVLGLSQYATHAAINEAYRAAVRKQGGATVDLNRAKEEGLRANGET